MQNSLIKCPYCAEDIQQAAKKCKHCGEWLDKPNSESIINLSDIQQATKPNNAANQVYTYLAISKKHNAVNNWHDVNKTVVARNQDEALEKARRENSPDIEIKNLTLKPKGLLSCPNCASPNTVCSRDIGCVAVLIIFVSFGLGLLLIPLLPHKCHCEACGYSWKS